MQLLRRVAVAGLGVAVLGAPAAAAAKADDAAATAAPRPKIRALGTPPRSIEAGESFRLTTRVRNTAQRSIRPRVTVTLRRRAKAKRGVRIGVRRLRVAPGATRRVRLRVRVPATIRARRWYVVACVRAGGRRAHCRAAPRRLRVLRAQRPVGSPSPAPRPAPKPKPEPNPNPEPGPRFRVLAVTGASDPAADEAVQALRELGRAGRFTVASPNANATLTKQELARYRAVVLLNAGGDVFSEAEQTALEAYYRAGGGLLAVGAAIAAEPEWDFLTEVLGARAADGPVPAPDSATLKVADRGHVAGKALPEYWEHTDVFYNFDTNVRGRSHVIATVDESTYAGGSMGFDHPAAWCKDFSGGRSFYTTIGGTAAAYAHAEVRAHLAGAIEWTAGLADPVRSDCGATVLANYQQTKISAPPNLDEPIGFDVLPDGRVIQTARAGQVRLHDPATQTSQVIANVPVYTHSEDGLYGPAIDNDFATNKWVYLFYAPPTVRIRKCDGTIAEVATPPGNAPNTAEDPCTWTDTWQGYFQLSRFKFVDGADPHLDLDSEQRILKVANDRGACCHVAGDIDFDRQNNLWLVTGDDTPAGAVGANQFPPFNDRKTNEAQTLRTTDATGGTITITFAGETTAPIAHDASTAAVQAALEALSNVEPGDITVTSASNNTTALNAGNQTLTFRGQYLEEDVPEITTDASGLTGASAAAPVATTQEGDWFIAPHNDARRTSLNTNDLRGKLLRIKVQPDGSYTIPEGNLFPEEGDGDAETRPEIYAMGFRNPFRVQVDEDGVAYVTDYSPDSRTPLNFRGPAGTGRVEIVRKPSNYGWPVCYAPDLPMYRWNFATNAPLDDPPQTFKCGNPDSGPENTSRWNTGRETTPPIAQPDLWYSFNDNVGENPQGTPCFASYNGSGTTQCPQLFPELGSGGVGPHGAAKYDYDAGNASTTKLPPYYDDAIFFGEFTRDMLREIRLDSQNRVFKINSLFDCGQVTSTSTQPFECDNPMDMQFGPDGSFYLLTYGDGFFAANPDAGMYRFEYVKGQRAPQGVLGATPTSGQAPLTVQFSSEGSRDPDPADSISFAWDFDSDGTTDSVDPNPTHTYTANGVHTARLTVTDSSGKTDSKTTTITVGNTAPTVEVTVPVAGGTFDFGDGIPFEVTVTDPEDGAIDCDRVVVTFVLGHDTHGHAGADMTGCSGVMPTVPEDADHGGNVFGVIVASYTDDPQGAVPALTTDDQVEIRQKRQEVEHAVEQSGTNTRATSDAGGGLHRGSLGNGDWIRLNGPFDLTGIDSVSFRTAGGTGTVEIRRDAVDGPLVGSYVIPATGGGEAWATHTAPVTDPGGTHQLYLVFRPAAGGPTNNSFNLNWVEFVGQGVAAP